MLFTHHRSPSRRARLFYAWGLLVLSLLLLGRPVRPTSATPAPQTNDRAPSVIVLTFSGAVTPVLQSYLADGIRQAQSDNAVAVILRLDTPGGSVEVTKSIIQQILASPVPIIVYVAPAGARAGSAGTFLTLAAHLAVMAPGTSIGAASPVDVSGNEIDPTLAAKIVNILSADIENLAERRGERATEWAIAAVQEAAAATAQQALDLGVIDFIAVDVPDLLDQAHGRTVRVQNRDVSLRTAAAVTTTLEMSPIQRALSILADPSIATILLSLGVLGLFIEIRTPGFGLPGILGAVSLLMGLYALGQLDANLAGLALIAIALALFVAEAFTPTFGALALGGIAAFVLGGALLFDDPGVPVPWPTLITLATGLGLFVVWAGYKALAAQRNPVLTGSEGLIGRTAIARNAFSAGQTGSVFIQGEWWNATLRQGAVSAGQAVRVVARNGFLLTVEPLTQPESTPPQPTASSRPCSKHPRPPLHTRNRTTPGNAT
jgi:membrane-bound serine protease (ClpP class)